MNAYTRNVLRDRRSRRKNSWKIILVYSKKVTANTESALTHTHNKLPQWHMKREMGCPVRNAAHERQKKVI